MLFLLQTTFHSFADCFPSFLIPTSVQLRRLRGTLKNSDLTQAMQSFISHVYPCQSEVRKNYVFIWQISRINCSLSWSTSYTPKSIWQSHPSTSSFSSFSGASELSSPFILIVVKARKGPSGRAEGGLMVPSITVCGVAVVPAQSCILLFLFEPYLIIIKTKQHNKKTSDPLTTFSTLGLFPAVSTFPFYYHWLFTHQAETVTYSSQSVQEVRKSHRLSFTSADSCRFL